MTSQIYYTHNNGTRPYKVEVKSNNTIKIYKKTEIGYDNSYILYEPIEIFIGKSIINKQTECSGGHGEEFDGNSILLRLENNKYVFIGDKIVTFESIANIIQFISPVGNNDVPYPYAIDIQNNIYLFVENIILLNNENLLKNLQENDNNPYHYYYFKLIKMVKYNDEQNNYLNIKSFYIGNTKYDLTYTPYPEKNYNRIIDLETPNKLSIIDNNNKFNELTKLQYIELMQRYAIDNFIQPINKTIGHIEY